MLFVFPFTKYNTTLSPGFLGQRHFDVIGSLVHWFNNFWWAPLLMSLTHYGEDSGKYFE